MASVLINEMAGHGGEFRGKQLVRWKREDSSNLIRPKHAISKLLYRKLDGGQGVPRHKGNPIESGS